MSIKTLVNSIFSKKKKNNVVAEVPQDRRAELKKSFVFGYHVTDELYEKMVDEIETAPNLYSADEIYYKYCPSIFPEFDINSYSGWTKEMNNTNREYSNWRCKNYNWQGEMHLYWVSKNGPIRTREEACKLASKFWIERIFKVSLQDNGADKEGTEEDKRRGANMMLLATALKSSGLSDIKEECVEKAGQLIYDFYLKGEGTMGRYLSCDYGPCSDLYEILKSAGVDDSAIGVICPWKTNCRFQTEDNTLIVSDGYRNFKVI